MAKTPWDGTTDATNVNLQWLSKYTEAKPISQTIEYTGWTSGERLAIIQKLHNISQCNLKRITESETFADDAVTNPSAGEKQYTVLKFKDDAGYSGTWKLLDCDNSVFLTATSLVLKPLATLAAAAADTPEKDLSLVIAEVLAGRIIVKSSSGNQVTQFVEGYRTSGA